MVSVCMTTFNGEKYIRNQVDSILSELEVEDELIVSDDNSFDDTLKILNSYNDQRIKIYTNDNRKGIIGNFENAIKKSSGDYIFLSDQDDIWIKGKVEKTVTLLKKSDLVISDAYIIDENETKLNTSFFEVNNTKYGFFVNIIKSGYLGCAMAFKKEVKNYILPFPIKIPMHDLWIGSLVYLLGGDVTFSKEKMILYRRHGNNASYSGEKSKISYFNRIKYRFELLLLLVCRYLSQKISRRQ